MAIPDYPTSDQIEHSRKQKEFDATFKNILFFRWQYNHYAGSARKENNFRKVRLQLIEINSWDLQNLDPERYKTEFLTLPELPPL